MLATRAFAVVDHCKSFSSPTSSDSRRSAIEPPSRFATDALYAYSHRSPPLTTASTATTANIAAAANGDDVRQPPGNCVYNTKTRRWGASVRISSSVRTQSAVRSAVAVCRATERQSPAVISPVAAAAVTR
ncbi:Hypothetical protein CINCED_3A011780 [Cinara cedri]|uniref:Uncharacterized protein n=1 Tax=Cinara cedri TaxID=506608 RepID=A0A5E4N2W6_9HEMI|nr:Hypothetical protein CINCED_3A011780 [Cinara cedri]